MHENEAKEVLVTTRIQSNTMPPEVNIKIRSGKRDNAKHSRYELLDEFEAFYSVKRELNRIEGD